MAPKRQKYIDRMTRDLGEWTGTIEEYEVRASRGPIELQPDYERSIRDLEGKRDLLSNKLEELKKTDGDAWMDIEAGVETAKHELRDAFETARLVVRKAA